VGRGSRSNLSGGSRPPKLSYLFASNQLVSAAESALRHSLWFVFCLLLIFSSRHWQLSSSIRPFLSSTCPVHPSTLRDTPTRPDALRASALGSILRGRGRFFFGNTLSVVCVSWPPGAELIERHEPKQTRRIEGTSVLAAHFSPIYSSAAPRSWSIVFHRWTRIGFRNDYFGRLEALTETLRVSSRRHGFAWAGSPSTRPNRLQHRRCRAAASHSRAEQSFDAELCRDARDDGAKPEAETIPCWPTSLACHTWWTVQHQCGQRPASGTSAASGWTP
jgi:hypothetical protein